jgi:RNase H-fold protein (predicted Holliday junction resolvase)
VAVPLEVVPNAGDATVRAFAGRVRVENIDLVVVGVPLATGGHHSSAQLEKTRAFIAKLASASSVPVVEEDESFTTAESIRLKREEGAQADEDALAAMLIVQAYLDQNASR